MKRPHRRHLRHGAIALLCAALVFAILNLAAWYNLRDQRNVCRRQGHTRMTLQIIQEQVEAYRQAHDELPQKLSDIPDLQGFWPDPDGPPVDAWENPVQYRVTDTQFDLYSYGRDGKPGGMGLDAEIFHDGRNADDTLPTFAQYFGETDTAEVDRGGFFMAGLIAGGMVFFFTFNSLNELDTQEKKLSAGYLIAYGFGIILIASLIGAFLLPLHIPSGH